MRILVSNDDGVDAKGLTALAEAARTLGDVTVVAPHRERSAASHSLTLHKPLRIHKKSEGVYSASGSPADCVYLGVRQVLKTKPDVILSGINRGANLGTDVHYSGTVAAAREGALMNIPSYAFSLVHQSQIGKGNKDEPMRYEMAARIAAKVVAKTRGIKFPPHTLINVNIPNFPEERIKGLRLAKQGFRHYEGGVVQGVDPRGKEYFWVGGGYMGFEPIAGTDCDVIEQGYVTVTPIAIDCTHLGFYAELEKSQALD